MTVFETVGRGSIPWRGAFAKWEFGMGIWNEQVGIGFRARSSNGRTRRSERRGVGSNPTLATDNGSHPAG